MRAGERLRPSDRFGPLEPLPELTPAQKLAQVFDLYDFGTAVQRENLRRRHPGWSEDELDEAMNLWLGQRPGAEWGDGEGAPRAPGLST
jgi:hypothetical protein